MRAAGAFGSTSVVRHALRVSTGLRWQTQRHVRPCAEKSMPDRTPRVEHGLEKEKTTTTATVANNSGNAASKRRDEDTGRCREGDVENANCQERLSVVRKGLGVQDPGVVQLPCARSMIATRSVSLPHAASARRRAVVRSSSAYNQGPLPPSGTVGEDRCSRAEGVSWEWGAVEGSRS